MAENQEKSVLRETDDEARLLARRLLREARHATLATLEPETGHPQASRVTMANDYDGTPLILVSELSNHTPALRADRRSSLLVGELGKGDPLAHARMTVMTETEELDKATEDHARARARFLARHPKAALYVDFGDFFFFRLKIERISLNGGFGKAYALTGEDVLTVNGPDVIPFAAVEHDVVSHMNEDHSEAISDYIRAFGGNKKGKWRMAGLDPAGMDFLSGDNTLRIDFPRVLTSADEIRPMLVKLAKEAREKE